MQKLTRLPVILFFLLIAAPPIMAQEQAGDSLTLVNQYVPQAGIVGQGTMTYMVWDVYDAELIAPGGHYDPHQPFALRLSYKRSIEGSMIADTSAAEIRRQGFDDEARLDVWHQQMLKLFPNVDSGVTLTGVYQPEGPTCFFRDSAALGCVKDPQFGPRFFKIWLGTDTRDPDLRKALLGQS